MRVRVCVQARAMRELLVPRYVPTQLCVEASLRRIFANAHAYHINSIAVNSDQMSFLSADDLRINLWHLDYTDQSFSTPLHTRVHVRRVVLYLRATGSSL